MGIFSQLKDKITQYIDVYVKLFKINFIGRTANLLSYFMFALIFMLILFCIVLFSGFGLTEVFIASGLSKLASFFAVVGVYLIFLVIVVACRRPIGRFFASSIIRIMTEGDEEESE